MLHVVFQEADKEVLMKSFADDTSSQHDFVVVKDDYAVGPLTEFTEEGAELRKQWWTDVLKGGDYEGKAVVNEVNDAAVADQIISRLQSGEDVWIWAAQNQHDVSGYYWLISQLKDYQGQVYILYLNNLPFINEKGQLFYPHNLFQIPPREFLKARKLARPVTSSEFEVDPDEWQRLMNEQKGVRILEGGKKLVQADYDYFDKELLQLISADWIRASKVIHQFLSRNKITTGDAYLLWRIKQLVHDGKLDSQGELKGMKDFEVKKVQGADSGS